ncbi:hypothetical protein HMPREF1022_01305 [Desulfovibrio sp. 6_1_46AFAA]|uniref:glycosyltransferase n=1 Tax=unclassified Desulfovibrio TaxID=2593640 RepID=UPI0002236F64|nr:MULTISPECIES: glycosyltransferase [unclassified Desulfovibrio]EFL86011.2 hypothetical protein HMPREF0326_01714 [Desulfovibrio sp. 3_1_syn3]EGW51764.1 hypothetical protein HMPREF1022_01305 [Desulfovibrio sp. 6_1_46AFAA]
MPISKQLHILLANNYTARGGIPNVVASLANAMTERGHRVTIYSQKPVPRLLYPLYRLGYRFYELSLPEGVRASLPRGTEKLQDMYPLHPDVEIRPYSLTDNNLKIQRLRQEIRALSPDVCVCPFPDGSHLIWAVTLLGSGVPYVYSERHSPQTIETVFWNRKGRLAAMSGADAIHLLLPLYRNSVPEFLRERVHVIPNAVPTPPTCANPAGSSGAPKVLLWLGRLHEELKQCRLAMDAFALVAAQYPDWEMHVVGDGQDRDMLHAHAAATGLGDRLKLLGEAKDVWPVYAAAHAFCFSSRTEGMPNALLEAMACGLPSVCFASCEGVPDLVRHEENGLMANHMDTTSLAEQLGRLMADAGLRECLGNNARKSVAVFAEQCVFDAWERLLCEVALSKGHTAMDAFTQEPFASMARLSAAARREWLWRDFRGLMPDTAEAVLYWLCRELPLQGYNALISGLKKRSRLS